jgi:hypothetical protein
LPSTAPFDRPRALEMSDQSLPESLISTKAALSSSLHGPVVFFRALGFFFFAAAAFFAFSGFFGFPSWGEIVLDTAAFLREDCLTAGGSSFFGGALALVDRRVGETLGFSSLGSSAFFLVRRDARVAVAGLVSAFSRLFRVGAFPGASFFERFDALEGFGLGLFKK